MGMVHLVGLRYGCVALEDSSDDTYPVPTAGRNPERDRKSKSAVKLIALSPGQNVRELRSNRRGAHALHFCMLVRQSRAVMRLLFSMTRGGVEKVPTFLV